MSNGLLVDTAPLRKPSAAKAISRVFYSVDTVADRCLHVAMTVDRYDLAWYALVLAPYPHKINLDPGREQQLHWHLHTWCSLNFGRANYCVTWRPALSGSPSLDHPLAATWCFQHLADAVLFKLMWL